MVGKVRECQILKDPLGQCDNQVPEQGGYGEVTQCVCVFVGVAEWSLPAPLV